MIDPIAVYFSHLSGGFIYVSVEDLMWSSFALSMIDSTNFLPLEFFGHRIKIFEFQESIFSVSTFLITASQP